MKKILVILGHPNSESWNNALAESYVEHAQQTGAHVRFVRLGELKFDPILRNGYDIEQPLEPDLQRVKEWIDEAQHIVLFFPLWWGSTPALLKGFIDRILLKGWAFSYNEKGIPQKRLKGRTSRVVLTMDAPSWWYRWIYKRSAHSAVVNATLKFIGLSPVQETTIYSNHKLTAKQRAKWLQKIGQIAQKDAQP